MKPGKRIGILLSLILIICAAGFLYTYLQPRYTATIVSVGPARSVSRSGKHGRRTHRDLPLVVTYIDDSGAEHTVEATYRRATEPLAVGQQIEIVQSFNGFIRYPFTGLRMFCGFVGGGILLFLFFMWLDRSKAS